MTHCNGVHGAHVENDRLWVATDPLFYAQPNLYYSNVPDVWAMGYTGQGLRYIDETIQIDHPDLKNNVNTIAITRLTTVTARLAVSLLLMPVMV